MIRFDINWSGLNITTSKDSFLISPAKLIKYEILKGLNKYVCIYIIVSIPTYIQIYVGISLCRVFHLVATSLLCPPLPKLNQMTNGPAKNAFYCVAETISIRKSSTFFHVNSFVDKSPVWLEVELSVQLTLGQQATQIGQWDESELTAAKPTMDKSDKLGRYAWKELLSEKRISST